MNSLVIGGAGFIGSQVTRCLADTGREVVVLDRSPVPPHTLPKDVKYICGDYGDRSLLKEILASTDEVIDLAYSTVPKTSFENPVHDILSNLPAGVGLLEEAVGTTVRKMVVVSSGGTVYGIAGSLPISEEHPTHPISPYGITKLAIEKYARMFHLLYDLPVTIVRPGNAYGEGQFAFTGQGFIATAVQSILTGKKIEVFGEHGTIRDYLHVEDVARGIIAALEYGEPGQVYNIGFGIGKDNLAVLDVLKPLARKEGYPIEISFLPPRKFDVPANVLDSCKLRSISGWQPRISFDEGLERTWSQSLEQLNK
jgi:UDP-glucose 4-epimerase